MKPLLIISALIVGYWLGDMFSPLVYGVPPTDRELKNDQDVRLYKIHEDCYKACRPYRASAFTPKGECLCDMEASAYGG